MLPPSNRGRCGVARGRLGEKPVLHGITVSEGQLAGAMAHEPRIHVGEHGSRQAMRARIRLECNAKPPGTERRNIAARFVKRGPGIPRSMYDQNRQVSTGSEPAKGTESDRQPSIDGDNASEPLGIGQCLTSKRRRRLRHNPSDRSARSEHEATGGSGGSPKRLHPRARRRPPGRGRKGDASRYRPRSRLVAAAARDRSGCSNSRPHPKPASRSRLTTGCGPRSASPT